MSWDGDVGRTWQGEPLPDGDGLFAHRYVVNSTLGNGATGTVYAATDRLTGDEVAIKVFYPLSERDARRVRREIAALRALDLPGVVGLRDSGVYEGLTFLVMNRVHGVAFPGGPAPVGWASLRPVLRRLLDTLGRIHASGLVHRDLKPDNVLVCKDGQPVVLDFGLVRSYGPGDTLTASGMIMGTPRYLAPEQVRGEPVSPATDLYALGVMIYEALSGRLPHAETDVRSLMLSRITRPPRPIRKFVPDLPDEAVAVVDALLAMDPHERPQHAEAVVDMFGPADGIGSDVMPLLGRDALVGRLVEAARSGRSIDVIGAHGMGRTRVLHAVAQALAGDGVRVCWVGPGRNALESLTHLDPDLAHYTHASLDEVKARVGRLLCERLDRGEVVLVDDWERVDPWSAEILDRCRSAGAVIRARTEGEGEVLTPLTRSDLRALFAGTDRLVHLREDAAAALWNRTRGVPVDTAHEVSGWVRAGLARWEDGRLCVPRASIDRLLVGLRVSGAPGRSAPQELSSELEELYAWIELAWPNAVLDVLQAGIEEPRWRVEAMCTTLERADLVRRRADGRYEVTRGIRRLNPWSPSRRREAHARVARVLPPGTPGRLLHLVQSENLEEVAEEAIILADQAMALGRCGEAVAPLDLALAVLRTDQYSESAERVLVAWARVALGTASKAALDRFLVEARRFSSLRAPARTAVDLVELLRVQRGGSPAVVAAGADPAAWKAIPEPADPELAFWWHVHGVALALRDGTEAGLAALERMERWAHASGSARAIAGVHTLWGLALYWEGEFARAADRHRRAVLVATTESLRISALLNEASARLELHELERAEALAAEARRRAVACRHVAFEARAEWLLRSAAYRAGRTDEPDLELVEAAREVSQYHWLIALTEGALAWRAGRPELLRDALETILGEALAAGADRLAVLVGALAVACGADLDRDDLADRARRLDIPAVTIQALALLDDTGRWAAEREALAARVPRHTWSWRREVLSIEECLAR